MPALARWFGVAAAGSTVRREVGAGLATYLTLCYIVFVQPAVLSAAGMDPRGVLFATCVASAIGCFLMAACGAALGPALRREMLDLVDRMRRARGLTVLLVSHQPADARYAADRTAFVEAGELRVGHADHLERVVREPVPRRVRVGAVHALDPVADEGGTLAQQAGRHRVVVEVRVERAEERAVGEGRARAQQIGVRGDGRQGVEENDAAKSERESQSSPLTRTPNSPCGRASSTSTITMKATESR